MSTGLIFLGEVIRNGARTALRQVDPAMFLQAEQPAYQYMAQYMRQHGVLPTLQVMIEAGFRLPDGNGAPISYHIERMRTRAIYNTVQANHEGLLNSMRDRNMEEVVRVIRSIHTGVTHFAAFNDVQTLAELGQEVLEDHQNAARNPGMQGITLGYDYEDTVIGGAVPGDVVTLVARPNVGKSYRLIHAARAAWLSGASVAVLTMEMTNLQIARRLISYHAGLNPDWVRRGQLSQWGQERLVETVTSIAHHAPFHLMMGNAKKSAADVDAMIQEFAPDIVYIDASYLMAPIEGRGRKARWELLTDVGGEIKSVAMTRMRPIYQTVQFNREAQKAKNNDLSQIGGTDAVGQISTVVIGLRKGEPPYENTQRISEILKNREGPVGGKYKTNFLFDPIDFSFIDVIDDEVPNTAAQITDAMI